MCFSRQQGLRALGWRGRAIERHCASDAAVRGSRPTAGWAIERPAGEPFGDWARSAGTCPRTCPRRPRSTHFQPTPAYELFRNPLEFDTCRRTVERVKDFKSTALPVEASPPHLGSHTYTTHGMRRAIERARRRRGVGVSCARSVGRRSAYADQEPCSFTSCAAV